jgi:hypothetical protein
MHSHAQGADRIARQHRSWADVVADVPEFAEHVRHILVGRRHHTLATLRKDGSPRVSGIELSFVDGELTLGMMPGSRKLLDVRRDARVAIHGISEDPPLDNHSAWPGDVKIAGRLVNIQTEQDPANPADGFRVEISELAWTRVGTTADHLVIESWRPEMGFQSRRR